MDQVKIDARVFLKELEERKNKLPGKIVSYELALAEATRALKDATRQNERIDDDIQHVQSCIEMYDEDFPDEKDEDDEDDKKKKKKKMKKTIDEDHLADCIEAWPQIKEEIGRKYNL